MTFVNSLTTLIDTSEHETYEILFFLGAIIVVSKLISIFLGKFSIPKVLSYLITGLVIGLIAFFPDCWFKDSYNYAEGGLKFFAKVGVVLIMFSAGLETDIKKIKQMGVKSVIITSLGVIVPILLGFLAALIYNNVTKSGMSVYTMIYYGVILSATSVSITVAVLKELNKIDTPVGTALISAAILDDIIGIIVLSVVIAMSNAGGSDDSVKFASMVSNALNLNEGVGVLVTVLFMILYFALTLLLGVGINKLFKFLDKKHPHHIRITIFAFGLCFVWAYLAEFFNIADITGAFMMGLIISTTPVKGYVDHRSETLSDNIFTPVFFALIAVNIYTGFQNFSTGFLIFGIVWVVVGLISKVIGAGLGAKICKFKNHDCIAIGVGMMARAEVLIVCAQKGIDAGLVDPQIMIYTLVLILVSSFLTPIFLKLIYRKEVVTSISKEDATN